MSINIVYFSTTNNIFRFVEKVKTLAIYQGLIFTPIPFEKIIETSFKENFHLVIPTRGKGELPDVVEAYLPFVKNQVLSVSGSGNRNWGQNFCKAVDRAIEIVGAPEFIKFELSGTQKEVYEYVEHLKKFHNL